MECTYVRLVRNYQCEQGELRRQAQDREYKHIHEVHNIGHKGVFYQTAVKVPFFLSFLTLVLKETMLHLRNWPCPRRRRRIRRSGRPWPTGTTWPGSASTSPAASS